MISGPVSFVGDCVVLGSGIQRSLLPAWVCQLVNSAFIVGKTVGRTSSMHTQCLYIMGCKLYRDLQF